MAFGSKKWSADVVWWLNCSCYWNTKGNAVTSAHGRFYNRSRTAVTVEWLIPAADLPTRTTRRRLLLSRFLHHPFYLLTRNSLSYTCTALTLSVHTYTSEHGAIWYGPIYRINTSRIAMWNYTTDGYRIRHNQLCAWSKSVVERNHLQSVSATRRSLLCTRFRWQKYDCVRTP